MNRISPARLVVLLTAVLLAVFAITSVGSATAGSTSPSASAAKKKTKKCKKGYVKKTVKKKGKKVKKCVKKKTKAKAKASELVESATVNSWERQGAYFAQLDVTLKLKKAPADVPIEVHGKKGSAEVTDKQTLTFTGDALERNIKIRLLIRRLVDNKANRNKPFEFWVVADGVKSNTLTIG